MTRSQQGISRRRFLQIAALTGAGTLAGFGSSLVWANKAVRHFENNIVVPLTPWFVNTYLVRGERAILVDTGFPTDGTAIRQALALYKLQPKDLALIFITHGHYDHFGSATDLKSEGNVPVSIHPDESNRLIAGITTPVEILTTTGHLISAVPGEARYPVPVIPDVFFTGSDQLDSYGVNARVIHTPGHTKGSLSLVIDGIAIIGDLLAGNLLYPNQPSYPFFIDDYTDQPQILTSLGHLLEAGADIFFPGHGLPFDRVAATWWLERQI